MSHVSKNARLATVATASAVVVGALLSATLSGAAHASSPSTLTRSVAKAPPIIPLPPPSDFVQVVDNTYLPFLPGSVWTYGGVTPAGQQESIRTVVLHKTMMIKGIHATVVRDVGSLDGVLRESTLDWYAQDRHGRVWYLGEDTKLYNRRGHVISTEGSWETGVDGAQAGIVMFPHPALDVPYRQEFYRGHAEDQAQFWTLSTQAVTTYGHFNHVRMTEETTPLDPTTVEAKFYAPGIGIVQEFDLSAEFERIQLLTFRGPA